MVLVTLTENIFKHGNLSEADHPATITIKITEAEFEIKTINLINTGVEILAFTSDWITSDRDCCILMAQRLF